MERYPISAKRLRINFCCISKKSENTIPFFFFLDLLVIGQLAQSESQIHNNYRDIMNTNFRGKGFNSLTSFQILKKAKCPNVAFEVAEYLD